MVFILVVWPFQVFNFFLTISTVLFYFIVSCCVTVMAVLVTNLDLLILINLIWFEFDEAWVNHSRYRQTRLRVGSAKHSSGSDPSGLPFHNTRLQLTTVERQDSEPFLSLEMFSIWSMISSLRPHSGGAFDAQSRWNLALSAAQNTS